jgi:hypothetical protein
LAKKNLGRWLNLWKFAGRVIIDLVMGSIATSSAGHHRQGFFALYKVLLFSRTPIVQTINGPLYLFLFHLSPFVFQIRRILHDPFSDWKPFVQARPYAKPRLDEARPVHHFYGPVKI